jgi:hypothetical protein
VSEVQPFIGDYTMKRFHLSIAAGNTAAKAATAKGHRVDRAKAADSHLFVGASATS